MSPRHQQKRRDDPASRFATWVTHKTGSTPGFIVALSIIVIWACTGPIFHFSNTWQLVINSFTTIVTFLMVFLIQRAQNRDTLAVQLKLNEIVAGLPGVSNRLISVEDLSEEELKTLHRHFQKLAEMAKHDANLSESHSIEEAEARHHFKHRSGERRTPNAERRSKRPAREE